jgi:hypothetical protein
VVCPDGFESPGEPLVVAVRSQTSNAKRPVHQATCVPLKRTVVIGVRVNDGPNLPVMYLGHEIARTDSFGAAHAVIQVSAGEPFRVTLDTSSNPALRPANPSAELSVGEGDDIVVFEPKVAPEKKPTRRMRRPTRL